VHGFVELQLLLGARDWEKKAAVMIEGLRPVFIGEETAPCSHFS
jgi:hypothetical protein